MEKIPHVHKNTHRTSKKHSCSFCLHMNELTERGLECLRQPAGTWARDQPGEEQEFQGQLLTSFSEPEWYEAG